jgi:tRNA 2-thiouridine synthesizing protein C
VDDGVLQLKKQQSATFMGLKDIAAIFQALEVYDVKELYVEQESLQARALTEQDLILSVKLLARSEITALIKLFDVVVPD